MSQLLSLSRAARLAGVSRGELQQRIRRGTVVTFEGEIAVTDLLKLFPHVDLDRDPILERLEHIKATAKPKTRYGDGWLPEPQVLMARLHELNSVLVRTKTALNRVEKLLRRAGQRLDEAAPDCPAVQDVQGWIQHELSIQAPVADPDAQLFAKDMLMKVIAANVKVQPSGHEFFVEGSESILEAGLKAGLHLDYGCSSGNCGACKCRVTAGEVERVRDHDYVLSPRERQQGYILACSWTAVTDVTLEAAEARCAADLPRQEIRTTVRKVEPISPGLALLQLQTPRTQTLRFLAGQSAELCDEEGHRGRYPIASCPCDGRHLEFLIRQCPGDTFADAVLSRRVKSQVVRLIGPEGDFTLREETSAPQVFVAFGHGFAPVKALVEHSISIDHAEQLDLYRIDEASPGSRLDNLCRAWNDSLDNFTHTRLEPDIPARELVDRMGEDLPDLTESDIYVAGPAGAVDAFTAALRQRGIDPTRIQVCPVD